MKLFTFNPHTVQVHWKNQWELEQKEFLNKWAEVAPIDPRMSIALVLANFRVIM